VRALKARLPGAHFIGAGGPKMAEAGVQLTYDLTTHSAIGPTDAIKNLGSFVNRKNHLVQLAKERQPELIILVDSYSFTQPIAHAVKNYIRANPAGWQPKVVRYTSPQVWASRPGRAEKMAPDIDLLLTLFPFEKDWYAKRGTKMRVEFVGHPIFDRYPQPPDTRPSDNLPVILLLPGSRTDEVRRHLPVMLEAAGKIAAKSPARFKLVAPNEKLAAAMRPYIDGQSVKVDLQVGQVADALAGATLALSKTGTITVECAYFGVPTITMYKVNGLFYAVARRLVTVKYASMPNLLADEPLFPEFIQTEATPENLAKTALELLSDEPRRERIRGRLKEIISSLGRPGSLNRAADSVLRLFNAG
jgi:lipid-A-disaccharide synthase